MSDKMVICGCANEDCRLNGCAIVRGNLKKPEIVYAGIVRGDIAKPVVYEDSRILHTHYAALIDAKDAEIVELRNLHKQTFMAGHEKIQTLTKERDDALARIEVQRVNIEALQKTSCGIGAVSV